MTPQSTQPPGTEQVRRDALLAGTCLSALALYILYRQATAHPFAAIALAVLAGSLVLGVALACARLKDGLAARNDPPRAGVIIGTVMGDWRLARPRPYTLTWDCFRQHVLITGPTGRGKTYGFVQPILRAHIARPATGVLYMDGKGDPIHVGPDAVRFDHVFCPEDPKASARWNPLAGPSPTAAARSFADALFPAASLPNPIYYEVRGAFAIRTIAPALAFTAHGVDRPPSASAEKVIAALMAAGLSEADARYSVREKGAAACEDQLRWLPTRDRRGPEDLKDFIDRAAMPAATIADELLIPALATPTIAALHRALFTDGELDNLADALDGLLDDKAPPIARERVALLARQVRTLAALPAKERAGVLSNLENRLAVFLAPPFDRLCSASDFTLADVCQGKSIAMLLATGSFAGIAEPLGRVALSQFQHAVLASAPQITKMAVLDEFHNFASPSFTRFLSQARSRGGAAVMSTQTIADFDDDYRDALLANASTQIVTPGSLPFDAEHWSRAFGEHQVEQLSETIVARSVLEPAPRPTLRRELRDAPRHSPTAVTELGAGQALVRQVGGRTAYPPQIVDVERHA